MYVDLVLCTHGDEHEKKYLFVAPPFSNLEKGTHVIVDTVHGEKEAVVYDSVSVEENNAVYNFILSSAGAFLPLKRITKKIQYNELKYTQENENEKG